MRIGKQKETIIEGMKADGYVWLSDLSKNAVMRFRNWVRSGFSSYVKIDGLTFLTKKVAESLSEGTKSDKRRLTLKEQNAKLVDEVYELERELYEERGVGPEQQRRKYEQV